MKNIEILKNYIGIINTVEFDLKVFTIVRFLLSGGDMFDLVMEFISNFYLFFYLSLVFLFKLDFCFVVIVLLMCVFLKIIMIVSNV